MCEETKAMGYEFNQIHIIGFAFPRVKVKCYDKLNLSTEKLLNSPIVSSEYCMLYISWGPLLTAYITLHPTEHWDIISNTMDTIKIGCNLWLRSLYSAIR